MSKKLLLFLFFCLSVLSLEAQPTARAQFVNNSGDMAFNGIDIYIDGVLTVNDLDYRSATAFLDVPATMMLAVGVAPNTSTSSLDVFFTKNMMLQPSDTVIAIANGLQTTTGYTPFMPFRLDTLMGAREMAHDGNNVEVVIAHGATDAPVVDFRTGIQTLVDNMNFGSVRTYLSIPFGSHTFRVTNSTGSKAIQTYSLPLSTITIPGSAGIIITSGFLDPSSNNNGQPFSTMFVPATGGPFIPLSTTDPEAYARVQLIHNSADKSIDTVDIYMGPDKIIDNLPFRTSSAFLDADVVSPLNIGIAPKTSTSVADVFHTQLVKFDSANRYVIVADGLKSTSGYTPYQPFAVRSFNGAREEATASNNTDILVLHSSTDFPAIDLREGTNILADNLSYGNFTNYIPLSATSNYIFTITDDANTTEFAKYKAQLLGSGLQGQAITLLLSGFKVPANNSNGAEYGLYYAPAIGGTLIPLAISTSVNDIQEEGAFVVWPNPATDKIHVTATEPILYANISDITGKQVAGYIQPGNNLDISKIPSGVYFLKLTGDKRTGTYQFIKE